MAEPRDVIRDARRVVVKIGSSSITAPRGGVDLYQLQALTAVVAKRWLAGAQVLLVSSGAIAAGMTPLGLTKRPKDLATQQAAASAGQGGLVAAYTTAFQLHGLNTGQVLLTADDLHRRSHYVNASRTLEKLLELEIVPVINENDTVATDEIRFGDNDRLAALVAHLVDADALILLTDVDALYDGHPRLPGSSRIPVVTSMDQIAGVDISATGSAVGTGGMVTKVAAAQLATAEGINVLLTSAQQAAQALAGDDVGTLFTPTGRKRRARSRWLAHASNVAGRLVLDNGAVEAVVQRQTSLLPVGVTRVEGVFHTGDTVDLCDPDGRVVARGLVGYDSVDLIPLVGRRLDGATSTARSRNATPPARTVIRRDDLVVF
ncbi:glutamate 5-kinase [Ornithinimicrobium cryptoxanthini]|uniref:Glutamate 5-kinase n=1 Tax=Ornithinimicrobium cryptoxanthini TaxID=2934161 RepID=A0ABY4YED3_9MICO|nr:glutamate 5-kinase [Ornithinimicrobium cryptoxanthini]USQ75133.1 glutamate 5-kinase [Ornithinimicrobium cryptoxanthini]